VRAGGARPSGCGRRRQGARCGKALRRPWEDVTVSVTLDAHRPAVVTMWHATCWHTVYRFCSIYALPAIFDLLLAAEVPALLSSAAAAAGRPHLKAHRW
jgi:hypothetical protein